MSQKNYLREDELYQVGSKLGLTDVQVFEGREDAATFLATYNRVQQDVDYRKIKAVKVDENRNYYFIIGNSTSLPFDVVKVLNQKYRLATVTSANAKLLFPQERSRAVRLASTRKTRLVSGVLPIIVYNGKASSIPPNGAVVIGRGDDGVNLKVRDNGDVSRRHCKIYYDDSDDCVKIDDLSSKNGTYVNGYRLKRGETGYVLDINDRITLAGERFEIREN